MKKNYLWLSYDLGLKGDYQNLYAWLDNHNAKECGDSIAFIEEYSYKNDFFIEIKQDILKNVEIKKTDRIYIITKNSENFFQGRFINGSRKNNAPWSGFGNTSKGEAIEDGDRK
ncbi:MAG: hypothetical protein HY738_10825 [Bacteroidia bacterium]|nr:hypothetical protein [Bacteroidia bacterium]